MAQDYDDRRSGDDAFDNPCRGYGRDDAGQGSRWTRGDDRPRDAAGDSWGERIGNRINRFFTDLERDYGRGGQARPDDRPEYGRTEYGRTEYGRGDGRQQSQFDRTGGGGGQGPGAARDYRFEGGGASGYGMSGGYASGGGYGPGQGGQGAYGQGSFGAGGQGYGQGSSGQGYGGPGSSGQGAGGGLGSNQRTGRPPKAYARSDARIEEDVYERLSRGDLDAHDVVVAVKDGEVTLSGAVPSRQDKRRAEDLADDATGVRHVQNNIRVDGGWGAEAQVRSPASSGASQGQGAFQGSMGAERDTWAADAPLGGVGGDATASSDDVPAASFGVTNPKTS